MIYKTLSLRDYPGEPFATLVATGFKDLETRTWRTHYRGPLAIHCSKGSVGNNAGKILALVDLVDCFPFEKEHERRACCPHRPFEEKWAWELTNLRIFTPAHVQNGSRSFWQSDDLDESFNRIIRPPLPVLRSIVDPKNLTGWDQNRKTAFPLVFQNWL